MTNTVSGSDVTVTIGGEAVAVPPMSFAGLKRAWPAILGLADKPHVVAQAEAAVEIVAAALQHVRPDLTIVEIEARLIGREFLDLLGRVPHLLAASGLVPAEGGGNAAGKIDAGADRFVHNEFDWDDRIAQLVGFGIGSWDDIERTMTLPRYQALCRHWEHWPPVEMLLAAVLGIKAPEKSDLGALVEMLGTGTFG